MIRKWSDIPLEVYGYILCLFCLGVIFGSVATMAGPTVAVSMWVIAFLLSLVALVLITVAQYRAQRREEEEAEAEANRNGETTRLDIHI